MTFFVLTIHILGWAQYILIYTQECHNQYRWLSLQWRHNRRDSVSNHQPHDCFRNRLFRHRSKKTSKLRVTVLSVGNSPEAGEFPAQMASNAENVSIWWRHHGPFHLPYAWEDIPSQIAVFTVVLLLVNTHGQYHSSYITLNDKTVGFYTWTEQYILCPLWNGKTARNELT